MNNHLLAKIGQYVALKNKENKVLILQRARSKTWCLPGGRIHEGENWEDSLLREIKEEINVNCKNLKPFQVDIEQDQYQIKYCVYFIADMLNEKELLLSDEHSDYKWIGADETDKLNFESEKIKIMLKKFFNINE